jgi:hypothetical protein
MTVSNMFTTSARNILKALAAFDVASGKVFEVTQREITLFLDKCAVAGVTRDKVGCDRIAETIKTAFADAVALGQLQQKTVTEYAQGAMRAYHFQIDWTPTLKNDKARKLPWSLKGGVKGAKSGTVKTTNDAAVIKTMVKVLEQLRLMGRDDVAQGQMDLILEIDPEFTEAV